jgi:hypothetical protein
VIKLSTALGISITFIYFVASTISAVTITPDITFVVGNERYVVDHTMKFHTITIAPTYIIFNTTGFYLTSEHDVTITLFYINSDIMGARDDERLLSFTAAVSSGTVTFSLSGFSSGTQYRVRQGGSLLALPTADASGYILFSADEWSSSSFEIYQEEQGSADTTPPVIDDISLGFSDPLDTDANFGWENITCTVTDDTSIDDVRLIRIYPDSTEVNESMSRLRSTQTYYFHTTFSTSGNYSYFIWASDTSGNTVVSSSLTYAKPPNWDVNENGGFDLLDVNLVSLHYEGSGVTGWIREDIDNNGFVQLADLLQLADHYGDGSWWT